MSNVAKELRELAREIERVCHEAPCMSVAMPIVHHCVDHLCLLAGWHEAALRDAPPGLTEDQIAALCGGKKALKRCQT